MAMDWKSDLDEEADEAIAVGLTHLRAHERGALETAMGDIIERVQRCQTFPVRVYTKTYRGDLVIWDWRVLGTARQAAREGWRVRLAMHFPKGGPAYVTHIDKL